MTGETPTKGNQERKKEEKEREKREKREKKDIPKMSLAEMQETLDILAEMLKI